MLTTLTSTAAVVDLVLRRSLDFEDFWTGVYGRAFTKASGFGFATVLRGSWAVISGVISPLRWVVTIVALLITLLITTHEPPSSSDT